MQYGVVGSGSPQIVHFNGRDVSQITIDELKPSKMYSIQVAAWISVGIGMYSSPINQLTSGKNVGCIIAQIQ